MEQRTIAQGQSLTFDQYQEKADVLFSAISKRSFNEDAKGVARAIHRLAAETPALTSALEGILNLTYSLGPDGVYPSVLTALHMGMELGLALGIPPSVPVSEPTQSGGEA